MSRTRRIYNRIRKRMIYLMGKPWYHPYIQLCCGHCRACKDVMKTRREKLQRRMEFRKQLENE